MLDLFAIFSKGGIVLWCFQSTSSLFTPSVNALIRSAILQERSGNKTFEHEALMLQYKLDNEFELVFVVAYQKILQLSYVDKFLDDIHLEFRDKYKNDLHEGLFFQEFEFKREFDAVLREAEEWSQQQSRAPKQMRTFKESHKSKKTVASMVEKAGPGFSMPAEDAAARKEAKKAGKEKKKGGGGGSGGDRDQKKAEMAEIKVEPPSDANGELNNDAIMQNRQRLASRLGQAKKVKNNQKSPKPVAPSASSKEGKKPRVWDLSGNSRDLANLERTRDKPEDMSTVNAREDALPDASMVGQMKGHIHDLEIESDEEDEEEEEEEEEEEQEQQTNESKRQGKRVEIKAPSSKGRGGVFSLFRGLVGSKNLTHEDMQPVLEKLKDHLITKNVAADISLKLCESVASQLEGKVLGTFESVASTVRGTLTEALVQILSPKRRLDILRDIMEAKRNVRPYVMSFCGVNGVGKSTNLAKICFWLIENGHRVLIAACDTFRAGAVEQLRTHVRHLNALHPPEKHNGHQMVQLYEKGYGKDAAGIAMEAINYSRDTHLDVVLIDTAGRMQDNEPLMRALAKLIKVNEPDMVLFVGEALVGNEAVDQLVKFNRALADHSDSGNPHLIDGIVLTKFDTIDDKVGAAISMTYITGQPIVFVGTGQTYTDLRSLNAKAVVHALMK